MLAHNGVIRASNFCNAGFPGLIAPLMYPKKIKRIFFHHSPHNITIQILPNKKKIDKTKFFKKKNKKTHKKAETGRGESAKEREREREEMLSQHLGQAFSLSCNSPVPRFNVIVLS